MVPSGVKDLQAPSVPVSPWSCNSQFLHVTMPLLWAVMTPSECIMPPSEIRFRPRYRRVMPPSDRRPPAYESPGSAYCCVRLYFKSSIGVLNRWISSKQELWIFVRAPLCWKPVILKQSFRYEGTRPSCLDRHTFSFALRRHRVAAAATRRGLSLPRQR